MVAVNVAESRDTAVGRKGAASADPAFCGKGAALADSAVRGKGAESADPAVGGRGARPAQLERSLGWYSWGARESTKGEVRESSRTRTGGDRKTEERGSKRLRAMDTYLAGRADKAVASESTAHFQAPVSKAKPIDRDYVRPTSKARPPAQRNRPTPGTASDEMEAALKSVRPQATVARAAACNKKAAGEIVDLMQASVLEDGQLPSVSSDSIFL